ncbi:MAG: hypothetical protein WCF85_03325 [Rhodospirillaceae bacterium]
MTNRNIAKYSTARPLVSSGGDGHNGDMDETWRASVDKRLDKLEESLNRLWNEVHAIKGALDWMKIAFTLMGAVMIGGFAFFGNQISALRGEMTAGFSAIRAEMREDRATTKADINTIRTEMREDRAAARADVAAQVNAIANAIIATRQLPPQIIQIPAPAQSPVQPSDKGR